METDLTDVKEFWKEFDREGSWLSEFESIFGIEKKEEEEEDETIKS
jgi:hypothetical protein